jgi:hypothetical protein
MAPQWREWDSVVNWSGAPSPANWKLPPFLLSRSRTMQPRDTGTSNVSSNFRVPGRNQKWALATQNHCDHLTQLFHWGHAFSRSQNPIRERSRRLNSLPAGTAQIRVYSFSGAFSSKSALRLYQRRYSYQCFDLSAPQSKRPPS